MHRDRDAKVLQQKEHHASSDIQTMISDHCGSHG